MNWIRPIACLTAVAAIVTVSASPTLGETFTSTKGYTITSAPNWKIGKTGFMGADVFLYAKPTNGFASNLNVVVSPISAGDTLDSATAQIKQMYPHAFTNYHSVQLTRGKLAGQPAILSAGTYLSGDKHLRMRQIIVIRGRQAYTFTCTSQESTHAKYDADFNKMLASVHWK